MNKKALSDMVTTSILIVMTVASISLAGYSVRNLLTNSNVQLSSEFNCLDLQTDISPTIKLVKACFDSQTGEVQALVQRNQENFNIDSLSFVLGEETWTCSQETCSSACEVLSPDTTRFYYITPNQNPLDKTLNVYVGSCQIGEVRINDC